MEGFTLLSVLSLAMFAGSYIFGSVPLVMTLSESRARIFSVFGAGLLVGTALSVIIPEGVQSIYDSQIEAYDRIMFYQQHQRIDVENLPRVVPKDAEVHEELAAAGLNQQLEAEENIEKAKSVQKRAANGTPEEVHSRVPRGLHKEVSANEHSTHDHGNDHDHNLKEQFQLAHKSIGLSLVIGFVIMLLIDQISRAGTGNVDRQFKITATIGLVVHAAADGVALASASVINKTDVQFIVFAAIMLHKGPAAFGLVSFLLSEGLQRNRVKKHLLIFSLSAPVTALVTYYAIATFGLGGESLSSGSTTGILMLFSAGTFLYVATVHVLSELVNNPKSGDFELIPTNTSGHSHSSSGLSLTIPKMAREAVPQLENAVDVEIETLMLWRSRKTVFQMFCDRGYMVTSEELEETLEEFKVRFGMKPPRNMLNEKFSHIMERDLHCLVLFPLNPKVGVSDMKAAVVEMKDNNCRHVVFIVNQGLTPSAKKFIGDLPVDITMEVFTEGELLVNVTEHELVPQHEVLEDWRKEELYKRYTVRDGNLPKMSKNDPIARYYGMKIGQVVKVTRDSKAAGRYTHYRLVC